METCLQVFKKYPYTDIHSLMFFFCEQWSTVQHCQILPMEDGIEPNALKGNNVVILIALLNVLAYLVLKELEIIQPEPV